MKSLKTWAPLHAARFLDFVDFCGVAGSTACPRTSLSRRSLSICAVKRYFLPWRTGRSSLFQHRFRTAKTDNPSTALAARISTNIGCTAGSATAGCGFVFMDRHLFSVHPHELTALMRGLVRGRRLALSPPVSRWVSGCHQCRRRTVTLACILHD